MKHILITGVTGNIGEACLDYFLDTTWRVTGVSRAECFETYVSRKLDFFDKFPGLDLTNYTRVHQFVKAQQPFDLVIMAHGIQAPLTLNQDDFFAGYNRIIESNLKSCVYLTHRLVAENKLRENSLIVYCGSIQAQQPRAGRGAYAVAKAGLEALSKTVAVELAPKSRAITLRLGQLDKAMDGVFFSPEQLEDISSHLPLPLVECERIPALIDALYSQPQISGCVIDVDSGHNLCVWP